MKIDELEEDAGNHISIYIYIYIYIYFRRDKKQKGTGVFGKLLKTFAEKITMS